MLLQVDTSWKNGWNDKKARDFCTKHFQTSKSFEVCRDHVPSVPSEKFINECVEDIKVYVHKKNCDGIVSQHGLLHSRCRLLL